MLEQGGRRSEAKSAHRGIHKFLRRSYSALTNTSGGAIALGLSESESDGGFPVTDETNAR